MRRVVVSCVLACVPLGCVSGPRLDNPTRIDPALACDCDNGVLLQPNAGESYETLFERVLDVVDDTFPIAYANRYEGRILGKPYLAPGLEQPWKPGSPSKYERLLATLQAYRYRCEVRIRQAVPSGYFVQVTVRKELKDYPVPSAPYTSAPVFGDLGTVDRDEFLVADPEANSPLADAGERWIPKGREVELEQKILRKIQQCHANVGP